MAIQIGYSTWIGPHHAMPGDSGELPYNLFSCKPGGVDFPVDGIQCMVHEQRYTISLPAARVVVAYVTGLPPSVFVYHIHMFY
jgi:hypothetical protein